MNIFQCSQFRYKKKNH